MPSTSFGSYPAISTSTNVSIESAYLVPEYSLAGIGIQHSDRCNTPNFVEYCPDCKHTEVHSYHCGRWDCPVCYPYTAANAARRVSNRLWGVYKAWKSYGEDVGFLNHIVISVPPSDYENFDEKSVTKKMMKYAKQIGLSGGAFVFHPYRIWDDIEEIFSLMRSEGELKGGNWAAVHQNCLKGGLMNGRLIDSWLDYVEFAPHFHIVGYFKLKERSDNFYERTGWTYKNVSWEKYHEALDKDGMKRTIRYLCTHHRVEKGKQSIRYFGIAAPNKVKRETTTEFKVAKCPECSIDYKDLDLNNNVIGTSSRGDLYRIPVRSLEAAEKLIEDIRYRRFKFKPEDYRKAWYPVVHNYYSVRTDFTRSVRRVEVVDDPHLPIPWATEKEISECEDYRNGLPAIDWEKVNIHRIG